EGTPAVEVLIFRAHADDAGHMVIETREQRCPGDCPGGRGAYFLGVHDAIDQKLASDPTLAALATLESASALTGLEYASRPDIVGGPQSLVQADANGVKVVKPGACAVDDLMESTRIFSRTVDGAKDARELKPFLDELDRRMAGVTNLVCHQTIQRHSISGRQVRRDVVDADLRIIGNQELYSDIQSNGRAYKSFTELPGAWASGDLVTMLFVTRNALTTGTVTIESRPGADGLPELGVTFERHERDALWKMFVESTPYPMAFEGTAWFSPRSGVLRQIEWKSIGTVRPPHMSITQVSWQVNFSTVEVAGESFIAPAAASYAVKYGVQSRREDRTQSTFTAFRRFAGVAHMLD
ncbi:MAG TPA: hypothetical protein VNH18_35880, partial [Bryobacteraceae bacterium]|nr:hypothetical protein [Bryobacteraceae bacterium]